MNKWISRSAFFAAALFLGLNGVNATTIFDTKSLNVQVAVSSTCSITGITSVSFPGIVAGVTFTPETASGNVTVLCTGNDYNVNADAGLNATTPGNVTTRNLKVASGELLPYHLVVNSATTEWGNATSGLPFSGTASSTPASIAINGTLPGGTPTASGVYSDVVIVTLTN
jgi:spore coat protein U-like protein